MQEATQCFQRLGLTQYESSALAALFSHHDATAQQISEIASIPYTKIYAVLTSLEKQGLLKTTLERPKKYRPVSPDFTINTLLQRRKEELSYIEKRTENSLDVVSKLHKKGEHYEQEGSVLYLPTGEAVWDMAHGYIKTFKKNIYTIATKGSWDFIFNEKKIVSNANKYCIDGKTIKQILPDSFNLLPYLPKTTITHLKFLTNPGIQTRFSSLSYIQPNILIADEKEVMIGFIHPKTGTLTGGIVIKDKSNANAYTDYFNSVWKTSKPISNRIRNNIQERLRSTLWKK